MSDELWVPPFAHDRSRWEKIDFDLAWSGELKEMLAGLILKFGNTDDGETACKIGTLYQFCVEAGMPVEHRWQVFRFIQDVVESMGVGADAYKYFIAEEPDRLIVANAVGLCATTGALIDNDPMTGPKYMVQVIQEGNSENVGAVFGGLLTIGDPRVCRLLWPIKDGLSPEEASEAAKCFSPLMSTATIEFILDWLESRDGTAEDTLFAGLATNLALQKRHMASPLVRTGLRPFPSGSVTDEEAREMAQWISFEEYRRRIAPRLLALEQAEPPPKTMSLVIHEWGIAVRDLSEISPTPQ